jgi:hypothetical protein
VPKNNKKLIAQGLGKRMWRKLGNSALIRNDDDYRRVFDYFWCKILENISEK